MNLTLRSLLPKTLILCSLCLSSIGLMAETLQVAVASNFTAPMKALAPLFEKETGDTLKLSFGSSGKFFAQIQHGAPFDVFLSADEKKPLALIDKGLATADSKVIYANGALALWSAQLPSVLPVKDVLSNASHIAIANPKLAPYGQAAKETLQQLGLWETTQSKLVQGENISQTYQFVYTQNAELGFVALSQVLAGDIKGTYWLVPAEDHQPIKQAAVFITASQHDALAKRFMAFLMRSDIQEKIATFGYTTAK